MIMPYMVLAQTVRGAMAKEVKTAEEGEYRVEMVEEMGREIVVINVISYGA